MGVCSALGRRMVIKTIKVNKRHQSQQQFPDFYIRGHARAHIFFNLDITVRFAGA